jgi:hypothetical protein
VERSGPESGRFYRLIGSFPLTVRFHVPDGYSFRNALCEGATLFCHPEQGNLLAVYIQHRRNRYLSVLLSGFSELGFALPGTADIS